MKLNPLADHLKGIVTAAEIVRSIPKETTPPLKKVVGGIIKRIAVDKTARMVTAPAAWLSKPLFEKVDPKAISHELEVLREELRASSLSLQKMSAKLEAKKAEVRSLVQQNSILQSQLKEALTRMKEHNESLNEIVKCFH